jgi:NAD(P)-dependent dehydrogenase (short-subunit alcohol dehydrogenase family)
LGRNNPPPSPGAPASSPADTHAIGRYGTTEEISKAVLWLMTEEASFVQGEVFAIDGASRVG